MTIFVGFSSIVSILDSPYACWLCKSLYGLIRASRALFTKLLSTILQVDILWRLLVGLPYYFSLLVIFENDSKGISCRFFPLILPFIWKILVVWLLGLHKLGHLPFLVEIYQWTCKTCIVDWCLASWDSNWVEC